MHSAMFLDRDIAPFANSFPPGRLVAGLAGYD